MRCNTVAYVDAAYVNKTSYAAHTRHKSTRPPSTWCDDAAYVNTTSFCMRVYVSQAPQPVAPIACMHRRHRRLSLHKDWLIGEDVLCMYRMYVCMYIHTYVCMYVCIYVWSQCLDHTLSTHHTVSTHTCTRWCSTRLKQCVKARGLRTWPLWPCLTVAQERSSLLSVMPSF